MKRIFDILFSTSILLLLFPILFIIGVSIIMESRGGMFFSQKRVGKNEQPFQILKFRIMFVDSEKKSQITVGDRDPRITRVGFFLRNYKLDELPQFWNVLIGEMSIVGPRPVMRVSFQAYPENIKDVIYDVKPGLTGIGSIIFRDEEELITGVRNKGGDIHDFYVNKIYPHKGNLELWYQKNKSLILDLQLIFMTAWVILVPTSKLYEKWFKDLPKRSF